MPTIKRGGKVIHLPYGKDDKKPKKGGKGMKR